MTITVTNDKVTASGNGTADTFSFSPIVIFTSIVSPDTTFDLEVTTADSDGVETLRSEGTGATAYAVILTSTTDELSSGSVRFPEAGGTKLAADESITIKRKVSLLQQNDLENQGGYFPDVQENSFDRAMMVAIQHQEEIDRSFKASIGEATLVDLTLPNTSTVSGGQGITLKTDKTGLEYASLTGTFPDPITIARGGTGEQTAAAAFTSLKQDATETSTGVSEIATQTEVDTGTDTSRIITPATLAAVGKIAIPISVSQMTPTVSNGCSSLTLVETTVGRPDLVVRDFSTSADEHAQFGFQAPASWNEGTVTFKANWTHAGGQTGGLDGVAWFLQGVAVTDDDTADQVYGTAVVVSQDGTTAKDIYTTGESGAITIAATPVVGDYLIFRIGRDVSHTTPGAPDDLDIDARLLGITLFLTFEAKNDA